MCVRIKRGNSVIGEAARVTSKVCPLLAGSDIAWPSRASNFRPPIYLTTATATSKRRDGRSQWKRPREHVNGTHVFVRATSRPEIIQVDEEGERERESIKAQALAREDGQFRLTCCFV